MARSNRTDARRPRRLRRVLVALAGLILLAGIGVWFAGPILAARLLPGIVERAANPTLAGRLDVGSARCAWFGPQRLRDVRLLDPDGGTVAELEIDVGGPLVPLALGSQAYGTVRVSGSAEVVRRQDGSTNLERTLAPLLAPASEPAEPVVLAPETSIELLLDALAVRMADGPTGRVARLEPVAGRVGLAVGAPIDLQLEADAHPIVGSSPSDSTPGTLTLDGRVERWTDASGRLTPDAMGIDLVIQAERVPSEVADVIAGTGGRAEAALAGRFGSRLTVNGSPSDLRTEASLDAPGLAADASLRLAERRLTTTRAASVTLDTSSLADVSPGLGETLARARETMTIDNPPRISLRIGALEAVLPEPGGVFDPRAIALDAALSVPPFAGTITGPEGTRPFALGAADAGLELSRGGRVRLTGSAGATLDRTDAGRVELDLTLASLFDDAGAVEPPRPGDLDGYARLNGLDTDLIQPLLAGTGVEVRDAIGPSLDIALTSDAAAIRLDASAERASASGRFEIVEDRLRLTDEGFSARLDAAGSLVGAAINPEVGPRLASGGAATLTVRALDAPLDVDSVEMLLDAASLEAEIAAERWRVEPHPDAPPRTPPIDLDALSATISLAPGRPITASLTGEMRHAESSPRLSGSLRLERFEAGGETPPGGLAGLVARRPRGSIELIGLEPGVIDAVLPESAGSGSAGEALAQLIEGAVRGRLEVEPDDTGRSVRMVGSLEAGNVVGDARARVDADRLAIERAQMSGPLTPRGLDALAAMLALDDQTPRLRADAPFMLRVDPVELAWDGSSEAPVRATLSIERAPFDTLVLAVDGNEEDETPPARGPRRAQEAPIETGPFTLEGLKLAATIPAILLTDPDSTAPVDWSAGARATRGDGALIGRLDAAGRSPIDGAGMTAGVRLLEVDAAWLDSVARTESTLADGFGETLELDVGIEPGDAPEVLRVRIATSSPRLRTTHPLLLELAPDRARLLEDARAEWRLEPAWASRRLLGPDAGVRFADPIDVVVRLRGLSVARGEGTGPARPGVLALDALARTGPIEVLYADGSGDSFDVLSASASTAGDGRSLSFSADVLDEDRAGDEPVFRVRGTIFDFADDAGDIDTSRAHADLRLVCERAPTRLIDALLAQGGMLADLLGPTTGARMTASDLPREQGTLRVRMNSSRASLTLDGRVRDELLRLDAPAQLRITDVGPGLGARVFNAMPLIGTIEKRPEDGPAVVTLTDLALPLEEGQLDRLDASITIDLGSARFEASPAFASVLRRAEWQVSAGVGKRLKPIDVTIQNGQLAFKELVVPLGEFDVEARGEVDLVDRTRDIVVSIPFGALAEEFAGDLRGDVNDALRARQALGPLGGALPGFDELTRVPFRITGSLDAEVQPRPDLELLIKQSFGDRLRPERVIEEGLRGIFDRLPGGGGGDRDEDGG